ncbi:MAG: Dethiobiotin synthetase [Leptolyngbyaceae cyanobacterium bins.59]|nr:Dethiobiotin synthetase [Leptolyngbyaceae cyanobacterium bins.59]
MDYLTARQFLMGQTATVTANPDAFLARLQQGEPPIPGQVTSILLALKVVFEASQGLSELDRELIHCLYGLAWESRQHFNHQQKAGLRWPPLLDEDLVRIAIAVKSIFADTWYSF